MIQSIAVYAWTVGKYKNEQEAYMALALREARKAARTGEVPIGAVIVKDGEIVGRGFNRIESGRDPTLHAEIIAIRRAAKKLGARRLVGCTMYVTVEPCSMCAGAAVLARLDAVVAGAESDKSGACGSVKDILASDSLNHRVEYTVGVSGQECAAVLSGFFKGLRARRGEEGK
ncbi:MAG: tRNA adenosine(34) deaminase TadA [Clostridiales Family XIII bacterium]|nr:tRNA adenosine(34) deaminase TadA [Clostridiales Family XIII bacterium]